MTLKESKEIFLLSSLDPHFHISGFVVWDLCAIITTLKSHSALELNGKPRLCVSTPARHAGLEKTVTFMVGKEQVFSQKAAQLINPQMQTGLAITNLLQKKTSNNY